MAFEKKLLFKKLLFLVCNKIFEFEILFKKVCLNLFSTVTTFPEEYYAGPTLLDAILDIRKKI